MTIRTFNPQSKCNYFALGVFILYSLSHFGLLLLGNHPFWDDWVLVDAPKEQIFDIFSQLGSFFNLFGHLHVGMLAIGPWFYRFATFILYYGIGFFFFSILRRSRLFAERQAFMAALLFLVLPFNVGRGSLILFPYTLCLFLFMLAWVILPRKRIPSLVLFFLSFNTNSLLVFYLLPLIEDFLGFAGKFRYDFPPTFAKFMMLLRQYSFSRPLTILLPFAYFAPKVIFFKPYGAYKGYNESFSLFNLFRTPLSHLKELVRGVSTGDIPSVLLMVITLVLIVICVRSFALRANNRHVLVISALVLYIGLFPYYILGLVPTFTEWGTRHQLLMPFGFSMLVVSGIGSIRPESFAKKGFAVIISLCVAVSIFNSALFRADALKQEAVQRFMANALDSSKPGLVVLDDSTKNALDRKYRFYELNGMLSRSLGHQKSFGVLDHLAYPYTYGYFDKYFTREYNAANHDRRSDQAIDVVMLDSDSYWKNLLPLELKVCHLQLQYNEISSENRAPFSCPTNSWKSL